MATPCVTKTGRAAKRAAACGLLAGLLALAACAATPAPSPPSAVQPVPAAPAEAAFSVPADVPRAVTPPHMAGRRIIRAAILLPFSSTSPAVRDEAASLLAAAELAMFENADDTFLLLPKDAGVTPDATLQAVRSAIDERVDVILGPLFSSTVLAAAPLARQAGVPMIAFTSDKDSAGNGVYMLSFLPEEETDRVVRFAARSGVTSLALLLPDTEYGARVGAAAQAAAASSGVRIVARETYPRGVQNLAQPALRAGRAVMAAPAGQGAILIPERGNFVRALQGPLSEAGANTGNVRFLGTGLWSDPEVTENAALAGGWFAAPDPAARGSFERRYRQTFERPPTRLAGMGYDSTALVARLTRGGMKAGVGRASLEKASGFMGVDGLFRFRADGATERGLAVLETTGVGVRVIDPAPSTFVGR